jgi:hypothetical protein
MKNISIFLVAGFMFLSNITSAQIKIVSSGNVGISTPAPAYQLDVNSKESRFFYSEKNALHINHFGMDPRLCSTDKIVFYKTDGSGFANIECQVLAQQADRNLNENIVSLENMGVSTIERLNGVSFSTKNDPIQRIQFGLFAQDVESVIPEAVFTNDSTKIKSLAYSAIIPYLVEAIKEQQIQIRELNDRIVSLNENLVAKGLIINSFATGYLKDAVDGKPRLDQNIPNPFSNETRIGCFIPETTTSSFLNNYSVNGTLLQRYNIIEKGKQFVTIDGQSLIPGTYLYSLVVDGKEVGVRKMILEK